ncbi:hypothetical protein HMPREF1870_01411 [Bacteroidales bacterium KA00344]|nr:hypothetical protein HMPREF1870_01411 [Bacteroidales bacterium KA00344]
MTYETLLSKSLCQDLPSTVCAEYKVLETNYKLFSISALPIG